jgi:hypothetical protein
MRTLLTALARLLGFVPEQEVYDWTAAINIANNAELVRMDNMLKRAARNARNQESND